MNDKPTKEQLRMAEALKILAKFSACEVSGEDLTLTNYEVCLLSSFMNVKLTVKETKPEPLN